MKHSREPRHRKKPKTKGLRFEYDDEKSVFDNLIDNLLLNNFEENTEIKVYDESRRFNGLNIRIMVTDPNDGHANKFFAERKECFDKWSKCPIVIAIPEKRKMLEKLFKQLDFMTSKEGLKWSGTTYWGDSEWSER